MLTRNKLKSIYVGKINRYTGYDKNRSNAIKASGGVVTYIKTGLTAKKYIFTQL